MSDCFYVSSRRRCTTTFDAELELRPRYSRLIGPPPAAASARSTSSARDGLSTPTRKAAGHQQRRDRRQDRAEHRHLEHHDEVRPPRHDRHVAGSKRPCQLGHARQPCAAREPEESSDARDVPDARFLVDIAALVRFQRLVADHRDRAVGESGLPQTVDRALRRVAVRIERVDGAHAWVSPSACSCSATGSSAGDGCSPAFSSQMEMIGTNFEKSA